MSLLFLLFSAVACAASKPNILFLMVDDLGWFDLSFNGNRVPTPNIDDLHSNSVAINRHYIHLMCSPSRSQFMTGRYAMHMGFGQMLPWDNEEIGGIPIGQPTLANWLQTVGGYKTYAVGKWHMGYASEILTPTHRGFDHFYGFYQGAIEYTSFEYIDVAFGASKHYDFWEDNEQCLWDDVVSKALNNNEENDQENTMYFYRHKAVEYITKHDQDQPFYMYLAFQNMHLPLDMVEKHEYDCQAIVGDNVPEIRYCTNLVMMDGIVGDVMNALKESNQWDNTIMVLTADNGANIGGSVRGCNYPLRGTKGVVFDGNIRTATMVGGGYIPQHLRGTQTEALFSNLDWTPTLLEFADLLDEVSDLQVSWDGVSQYDTIMQSADEKQEQDDIRDHIVLNIGRKSLASASIVFQYPDNGHLYKYIKMDKKVDDWVYAKHRDDNGWCVPNEETLEWAVQSQSSVETALPIDDAYLFDLTNDESERHNLLYYDDAAELSEKLIDYAHAKLKPAAESDLFHEPLEFLWHRYRDMDPNYQGDGLYVAPFLEEEQYMQLIQNGLDALDMKQRTAVPPALRKLYTEKWTLPTKQTSTLSSQHLNILTNSLSNMSWSYIAAILCCIVLVSMAIVYRTNSKYSGYNKLASSSSLQYGSVPLDA